jgi:DNA-binding GntR family transcriptional regulator
MPSKPAERRKSKTSSRSKTPSIETQVASVAERIRQVIGAGRYEPGETLAVAALQREIGVGPAMVREALRQLTADGVVEFGKQGDARIPQVSNDQLLDMLRVQDALMRLALEEMVTSPNYSQHMARLFEQARKLHERAEAKDARGILRGMIRYHELVGEASGNAYLISITRRHYHYHFERRLLDIVSFEELEHGVGLYEKATQALLRRDAVRAHHCMSMHNYDFIAQLAAERAARLEQVTAIVEVERANTMPEPVSRKRKAAPV